VQESLHNVAKHAQAHNVNIQMDRDGEVLKLVIEDDGIGIRAAVTNTLRPSFGMAGMHERVATLGGVMKVVSRKGEGTKISVTVPVPSRKQETELAGERAERALTGTGS
jgi:signal transduction histidine kinase